MTFLCTTTDAKANGDFAWVDVSDGVQAEVRLYDRLFADAQPNAGGKDFIEALNPESLKVVPAYVEPSLIAAKADENFQFERLRYFVADRVDHPAEAKPFFNRVTGVRDSWGNRMQQYIYKTKLRNERKSYDY